MRKQKHAAGGDREYWVGVVGEFEGSGLKQREFCERGGLKFTTFRNWLYRLRGKARPRRVRKGGAGQFVQIVPTSPKPGMLCKVHYGRMEVLFSDLPPTEYLGNLLRLMDR